MVHMFTISRAIQIPEHEIEWSAIRAQGSGGQNVNKVSTAVHLRFDITRSSLPDFCKQKLMSMSDERISSGGIIVIKAQKFRSQLKNKEDALERLRELILKACQREKTRKATKPTFSSKRKRMDKKSQRGKQKQLRGKVDY